MPHSSASNVISMADFSKERAISPEASRELLITCRDLASDALSSALSTMFDKIEEILFELAEKTPNREKYNQLLNARGLAGTYRLQLQAQFRQKFVAAFDSALSGSEDDRSLRKPAFDANALTLVDPADYEEALAVQEMAGKWRNNCAESLSQLESRISHLMNAETASETLPLSPKQICAAFNEACNLLDAELDVRLIILEQFERSIVSDVKQLYEKLNALLVANDVLPKIPVAAPKKAVVNAIRSEPASIKPLADNVVANPAASAAIPAGMVLISEADASLLGVLRQLMKDGQFPQVAGGTSSGAVVPALTLLQQQVYQETGSFTLGSLGNVNSALTLRSLKEGVLADQVSQIEALTIDIVAMLFDFIFDSTDIPTELKALIGRLQIPVLKAALLDGKFFSKKQHPVRRLLDLMAQLAVGWQSEEYQQRVTALIADVVNVVLTMFTDDIALFEAQEARLIAFQEEESQRAQQVTERSAKAILYQEQLSVATDEAKGWVASRLEKHGVPQVVRDFIANHGVGMLMEACKQSGFHSPQWFRMQEVMDQLIWSCEPKGSVEDRVKLVGLLQPMLGCIEQVLLKQPDGLAAKERFLAELVKCHAAAIRQGVSQASGPQIRTPVAAMTVAVPVLEEVIVEPFSPIEVPSHLPEVSNPEEVNERVAERWMQSSLRRGEWVEVEQNNEVLQMKLTWISPYKGVYVFTNRFGGNALSVTQEVLSDYMAAGKVRRIESGSFSERAVSNVLHRLEENG